MFRDGGMQQHSGGRRPSAGGGSQRERAPKHKRTRWLHTGWKWDPRDMPLEPTHMPANVLLPEAVAPGWPTRARDLRRPLGSSPRRG
eukprot:2457227-Alexandrium_andersonii.AAC.1